MGSTPAGEVRAFAPGRVNLVGEHTDYNDGLALPFAIEHGVTVLARRSAAPRIEVHALDLGETDELCLGGETDELCLGGEPERGDGWRSFVRGTVAELTRSGIRPPGARLEISGDIPRGAGLASSAALEVALVLVLIVLSGEAPPGRIELARLCSRVENEWVGARTGLLDQLASLFGERDHALRIDFRSLEITSVPLDLDGHRLVTLDSGSPHVIASSGYNQRRAECASACELLGLASLRDATLEMAERLPEPLNRRVRHIVTANERVDRAVEALGEHDFAELGRLLDQSHASLRDDYEISTPEAERAARRLKEAGALGARIIGGGFGGHVLGLLPPGTTAPPGALEVRPGPGARVLA